MPELPEVETIKKGLEKKIVNKKIIDFDCDWQKMINYPLAEYKNIIKCLTINNLRRRAKMLIIDLSNDWHILIHLKMTGQLVYKTAKQCLIGGHPIKAGFECLPNKFTHAQFKLSDRSYLFFNDVRKFGWLKLYKTAELNQYINSLHLGPEPLQSEFSLQYLKIKIKARPKVKIKQFLMDNKMVVGVGNIYSDEVCFFAGVKPTRLNKNLTNKQIELIHQGIKNILKQSIKAQGTTFNNYRNSDGKSGNFSKMLKVYGRAGLSCYKSKDKLIKIKIGGRSSTYCPSCQK